MNLFKKQLSLGFSLMEMITVTFVIALISAIAVANFRAGQRTKLVANAADTVTNAIRNAQNFALNSRQIIGSSCNQGPSAKSYVILFTQTQAIQLYGIDKCDSATMVDSYTLPSNTQVQANGYKIDGTTASALQIKFTTPFAQMTAANSNSINSGTFASFTTATVTVESTAVSRSRTVQVSGVSGLVGE